MDVPVNIECSVVQERLHRLMRQADLEVPVDERWRPDDLKPGGADASESPRLVVIAAHQPPRASRERADPLPDPAGP